MSYAREARRVSVTFASYKIGHVCPEPSLTSSRRSSRSISAISRSHSHPGSFSKQESFMDPEADLDVEKGNFRGVEDIFSDIEQRITEFLSRVSIDGLIQYLPKFQDLLQRLFSPAVLATMSADSVRDDDGNKEKALDEENKQLKDQIAQYKIDNDVHVAMAIQTSARRLGESIEHSKAECEKLFQDLQYMREEQRQTRSELRKLRRENSQIREERDTIAVKENRARDRQNQAELAIQNLKQELDRRTDEVQAFRRIVQEDPTTGEPLDNEVGRDFVKLCRDTQFLVLKLPNTAKPRLDEAEIWVRQKYEEAAKRGIPPKLMLRAGIFDIFVRRNIDQAIFGAPILKDEKSNQTFDSNAVLRLLEDRAFASGVRSEAVDWRRRTINCLSKLPDSVDHDLICHRLIRSLIRPSMGDDLGKARETDAAIQALCKNMYAFALVLRQSRSKFEPIYASPGTVVRDQDTNLEVECMLSEPAEDDESGVDEPSVVLTLWGALKKVHHKRGDEVILVPAVVVAE